MITNTKKFIKRTVALLLCAMLLFGAVPLEIMPRASAASWADPYMDQLKQYGVMVGGRPNSVITRAEMAAVLNRAFGFRRTGPIPFTDVNKNAWYYNDIVVSYNEGILAGTSRTTASPNAPVTREQALALIGRCLRYEESAGEVTDFSDGKTFSNWSGKYVRSALLAGVISGNPSGSFKPKASSTRGEIARMLSVAMGTLVNSSGVTELGGVFGNVTINSPNVTLRNTTIAGDLYLTGGVGLGNVILDNVKVLGRIIIAGGGEGESGEASVLLNNVTARKMLIDPATGQYVSVRALGNTNIPETIVKSNAYIQDDVRNNSMGLQKVIFEGPEEGKFTIAGNMKDVTLKSPESTLTVGDTGTGSVSKITVDEEAVNSTVHLEINASVDDIKQDTASTITGTGDIGHLDVGSNGCTSEILPDSVTVRPGVITEIAGIPNVDSEVAKELSQKPRLLEGYPKVKNIAPTTADAYFSTNKAGTLYWALTDAAKGALTDKDADTLIEQPAYGSGFKSMGTIDIDVSKKEFLQPLTELTQGGTYYISAVLVDAHGRKSPVKSQRIVTPDGTVPDMANKDYPSITDATPTRNDENADLDFSEIANMQATVMANKSCDLYYVVLAAGSTAPSTNELLSAAFPNPYGYGRLHLIKNTLDSFKITEIDLDLDGTPEGLGEVKESTSYDMYYWLTDADGEQSSQVQKITVTTKDITPPEFTMGEMFQSDTKATSVTLSNTVNEDATIYWVAVPSGDPYPKNDPDLYPNTDPWRDFLKEEEAKIQVMAGVGTASSKSGKLTAKANTQFNISITGLEKESAYDVYYLAQDQANNFSRVIGMYTAHTLDETPPTASQRFESCPEDSPNTPYAYSTIDVMFSEAIRYRQPSSSSDRLDEVRLMELYNNYAAASEGSPEYEKAQKDFTTALRDMIILWGPNGQPVAERTENTPEGSTDWVVDYRNVRVYQEGPNMVVSFVNDPEHPENSALNLESGARYQFHLQNISDDSQARNPMNNQELEPFTTVSARVTITKLNDLEMRAYGLSDDGLSIDKNKPIFAYNDITIKDEETDIIPIDIGFTATPQSTSTAADEIMWDMLLWFDTTVEFELYARVHGTTNDWVPVGGLASDGSVRTTTVQVPDNTKTYLGASMVKSLKDSLTPSYQSINAPVTLDIINGGLNDASEKPISYDFALHFVSVGGRTDRSSLNQRVEAQVTFVTGGASSLSSITPSSNTAFQDVLAGKNEVTDITWPNKPGDLETSPRLLWKQFEDGRAPIMVESYPKLVPTSSGVQATFTLSTPGTVYYVMSPETESKDGFALNPLRNVGGRVSKDELERYVRFCNQFGPDGDGITMASDLSVLKRMFPNATIGSEYQFDFPTNTNIMNPTSGDIASGKLVYGSVDVTKTEDTYLLSGLQPKTEYIMYLVTTTGTSGIFSPVTAYRFKTEDVTKPILWTQAANTVATINTTIDATVAYKLLQYDTTNLPPVLKQPFANAGVVKEFDSVRNDKSSWKTGSNGFMEYGATGSSGGDIFTVLDAMIENIESGGKRKGSLFDIYANEALKKSVRDYIENIGGDSFAVGSENNQKVLSSNPLTVDCEKWGELKNVTYCLVVCGYCGTQDNQSDYAFSAAYPIAKRRQQIKASISPGGIFYNEPDPTNPNDKGSLDGTLTINFTDNLCVYDDSKNPPERIVLYANGRGGTNPPSSGNYSQNVGDYINIVPATAAGSITPRLSQNSKTKVRSIAFDITTAPTNFSITLSGARFSGENSEPQDYPLQVNVKTNKTTGEVTVSIVKSNDPDSEWEK